MAGLATPTPKAFTNTSWTSPLHEQPPRTGTSSHATTGNDQRPLTGYPAPAVRQPVPQTPPRRPTPPTLRPTHPGHLPRTQQPANPHTHETSSWHSPSLMTLKLMQSSSKSVSPSGARYHSFEVGSAMPCPHPWGSPWPPTLKQTGNERGNCGVFSHVCFCTRKSAAAPLANPFGGTASPLR